MDTKGFKNIKRRYNLYFNNLKHISFVIGMFFLILNISLEQKIPQNLKNSHYKINLIVKGNGIRNILSNSYHNV